jgi:arginine decarboxylase
MSWEVKDSAALYGINAWGSNYFRINDSGNVEVCGGQGQKGVDLLKLTQDLCDRGSRPPLLVRVSNIIQSQVNLINDCFEKAIKEYGYKGQYRGVYPIKVNQQRHLVEEIVDFGKARKLGLECGSKPELLVALAMMDTPEAYIVCNGFKDTEYIETALLTQKIGRTTFIVIDRFAELHLVIQASKKLGIRPHIGVRAKLNTQGAGKWTESSGAKSKFGLTPFEIVRATQLLRDNDMLDCLELLHFHIGSQVPSIQHVKASIKEAARYFVELFSLGAKPIVIDVGGGLGVDYDGSGAGDSSTNYTEQEYCNDIVSTLQDICDERKVPHPNIISESGRFITAHSSILIFDVLGVNEVRRPEPSFKIEDKDSLLVKDLRYIYEHMNEKNLNEFYNDLIEKKHDTLQLFSYGALSLEQRAKAEDLYWACATKMGGLAKRTTDLDDIYWALQKELCDTFFCNFSVFQSLPDSWAVKQLFPVMPIQRLNERPNRRVTLVDLTCDSDGKIEHFIDTETGGQQGYLDVHELQDGKPYFMAAFLAGAYQEILGDLHNLFGDTDTVHITINEDGRYSIDHMIEGDTVTEVLSYLDYNKAEMVEMLRKETESNIVRGNLTTQEARLLLKHYEEGLSGYTYLE